MHLRSLTPSISLLLAFEAAARHGSFTKAAEELFITQSAVSRHVQALEASLQTTLFERTGRTIELTPEGALYAQEINTALLRIRRASMQIYGSKGRGRVLQLAVLPIFGTKWLMPRISRFYEKHPGAMIDIHSRNDAFELSMSEMDACITMGCGDASTLDNMHLADALGVVVASPQVLKERPIRRASDLLNHQLLQITSHFSLWKDCLLANGVDPRRHVMGPKFEYTAHLIQACVGGVGVGLISDIFIKDELRSGQLVSPDIPNFVRPKKSYFLVNAREKSAHPTLILFKEWLREELTSIT